MRLAATNGVVTILWSLSALASEQQHVGQQHHRTEASSIPIVVTINPEARVSVSAGDADYRSQACDRAIELPVRIVNMGSVTAQLEARLVDPVPDGSSVTFEGGALKGTREEQRVLRLKLSTRGFVDVTIAFRAKNDIADLDGRDRIHLLLECV